MNKKAEVCSYVQYVQYFMGLCSEIAPFSCPFACTFIMTFNDPSPQYNADLGHAVCISHEEVDQLVCQRVIIGPTHGLDGQLYRLAVFSITTQEMLHGLEQISTDMTNYQISFDIQHITVSSEVMDNVLTRGSCGPVA